MDFKYTNLKLIDLDKTKGIVRHYWNAFDNEDSDGDVIIRGSYARSIEERGPKSSNPRIKFLWQHLRSDLRGVPQEIVEDNVGLLATTQIIMGRPKGEGEDLLILYDAGAITEHSVGIDVLRRDEMDRRRILEIRLWEGSAVTWGANPLTPLVDIKEASDQILWLDTEIARCEKAMNSGVTDHTAKQFELLGSFYKQYRATIETVKHPDPEPTHTPSEEDLYMIQSLNRQLNLI